MTGTHLDGRANPGASRREGLWLFNKSLRRVEPACHRESVCAAECQLLRPERRSTDGQMILKVTPDRSEEPPDLLLCGAPLRNRTVDLLLTMNNRQVPYPQVRHLTSKNTSSHQLSQARGRRSRAPIATQSATQFNLVLVREKMAVIFRNQTPICGLA